MIILGLNAFHGDSAAALVRDGKLVAAAEEERFRRVKHWAGFPSQAIAYCLRRSRAFAIRCPACCDQSGQPGQSAQEARLSGASTPGSRLIAQRLRNRRARQGFQASWPQAFPASDFGARCTGSNIIWRIFPRPFTFRPFDEAVVVSVDGFGDFSSAAWGVG